MVGLLHVHAGEDHVVGLLHVHVRLSSVARSQSEQRRTGLHAVMVVVVVVHRIGVVDSSRLAALSQEILVSISRHPL